MANFLNMGLRADASISVVDMVLLEEAAAADVVGPEATEEVAAGLGSPPIDEMSEQDPNCGVLPEINIT